MATGQELRERLESLSIPREQRPGTRATTGRRRHSVLVGFLVLAVIALGAYAAWERIAPKLEGWKAALSQPVAVRVFRVSAERTGAGPAALVLTATGKIVSDHQVQVATKVSGQVVELHFEQGEHVACGQSLARIEDVAYRAGCDQARARLEKAKASLEFQKFNFVRVERLFQQQQASDIEYAEAQRSLEEARAEVAAGEALLTQTQKLLDDCEVVAPISGVILERNVDVGDFVAAEGGRGAMANSQFAVIADMSKLRVEVDVSELDVGRLHRDMACIVTPDARKDRHYGGQVMWIDPGANYAKATVQVKVRIEAPDEHLRIDGAAQVQFLSDQPASAESTSTIAQTAPTPVETRALATSIWIPRSACILDAAGQTAKVFVLNDGRLKETRVTLGRRQETRVEVLAGLSEGLEIAADSLDKLRDGQAIQR
jgi:RND family efflux transporter MFP subunit